MTTDTIDDTQDRKTKGGRPTKAAAAERDERILDIAGDMFLDQGFDATSMDGVAEAAMVGKATLYARYPDKGALFGAVLRRRIVTFFEPIEAEFAGGTSDDDLETTLRRAGHRLLDKSLSPGAMALGRILSAQSLRFPELGQLAVRESWGRQTHLIETILARFAGTPGYRIKDLNLAADLFLSIVLGRVSRMALLGVEIDAERMKERVGVAVSVFLEGVVDRPQFR